jgi:hypothetical protein
MSFGGINGAGPQGAPIFGNQGTAAAGAVAGQAGAPANGATPYFNASAESVLAAMSRGEIPANLGVSAGSLGAQVPLLQAIAQAVPQNGTNGVSSGAASGSASAVDPRAMSSVPSATNQYSGN